jgi:hypothetical protein
MSTVDPMHRSRGSQDRAAHRPGALFAGPGRTTTPARGR